MRSTRRSNRGRKPSRPTSAFPASRNVERRRSVAGAAVLHAAESGQAGPAAQRRFSRKFTSTAILWSPPIRPTRRRRSICKWCSRGRFGISEAEFNKAYHSFGVETALQRADELVQRYRIDGVPTFVVNGKYHRRRGQCGRPAAPADAPERLMALVGDLAAQEHKH